MGFLFERLRDFLLIAPALIITVTLHEFMHGYVSYRQGDPTPKEAGRLTLNPLRHLDPLGTLMIFLVYFGWGRPMPVNPAYYKNPRRGMMLTAVAGPLTNFAIAFAAVLILRIGDFSRGGTIANALAYLTIISIYLGVFNLVPIPPLDGSKVVAALLPRNLLPAYFSLEQYGILIIFLGFYFFNAGRLLEPAVHYILDALALASFALFK